MMRMFNLKWVKSLSGKSCLVPVGALTLLIIIMSKSAIASTGSGWFQQASWSGDDSRSATRSLRTHDSGNSTSPFSPGSHNLSLDLGQVFLMGGLAQYNSNIGTQLHYNYGVSDLFSFDSSVGFSTHSDGKYSMWNALTGIRLNFSWYDKIIPYGLFGLGFYRPSYADTTGTPGIDGQLPQISAFLFGFHFGPGIDLELSKNMYFGASITYHSMFSTSKGMSNGSPLNVGGAYTSFYMHIGTSF